MAKLSKFVQGLLVVGTAVPLLFGPEAYGQDALLRELIRKAEAREPENGFCATTNWPPTEPKRNDAMREQATVGLRSVDTHNNGAICSSLLVTEVLFRGGRKCLRYNYWVCERGSACGTGKSLDCKQADGYWNRTPE
jgi:hypothetical protein